MRMCIIAQLGSEALVYLFQPPKMGDKKCCVEWNEMSASFWEENWDFWGLKFKFKILLKFNGC